MKIAIFFFFATLFAEENLAQVSEAFGHLIYQNIKQMDVEFDMAHFVKGIQEGAEGIESPLSEKECLQALESIQEKQWTTQAQENLKEAELFLIDNAKKGGIVSLHEGKVQYRKLKEGNGLEIQPHSAPLISYTITKLDGTTLGPKEEEVISLDETIPGLKAGLIGMKEGEKRTLYIHPDFAYEPIQIKFSTKYRSSQE